MGLDIEMAVRQAWKTMHTNKEERNAAVLASDNDKFWTCVPSLFEKFPILQNICPSFEIGTKFGGHIVVRKINEGSSGCIFQCSDGTSAETSAMKVVNKLRL